ncbi:WXG100 family type VII secretion target [Paenibacillus sp. MER 99-2]|uniref:WXG100 family type VII secretion target n=1 Tax=Paenibacillus sp. MER 99-2 TaxID=2939572 RepID=UPI00203C261A|nr:WXG100 family type VII secretion target [Paenibacillus sp. MER 99-2]MCM3175023.1 WXG100 family type VII secretion target [Paenibacillus sp. MER 99-2]
MTTIKVKPGQLLAISKQFEEAHYQVSQMTNRLKQRIVEIEQLWDGSTKENFYANFIYAQQAMDKFLDGSITISKELERHAEKFKNADNQTLETYGPPESNDAKAPADDKRNAFQKSADSIVELGQAFLQSADDRYQKRYDSVGGFLDYWTFGIPSGLVSGYVDRAEKAFNSPNDAANWITFGIHGTIREATFPTNAWSSEHWANIFGVGGLMLGGGYASSMMKPHNLFTGGGPKINPSTRPGTGNMTGGFNGFQDQRMRVTENIAESKKARESSKFSEFVEKEKEIGKGTPKAENNIAIENAKKITHFDNPADPFRDAFGAGLKSHPEEWHKLIKVMEENGVEVVYREGALGYGPLRKGEPGQILIDPEASMSSLRHEYSHYVEAKSNGFPSAAESYQNWEGRIADELKAYTIEIKEAKRLGLDNIAEQLQKNFEAEKQYILDRYGPIIE